MTVNERKKRKRKRRYKIRKNIDIKQNYGRMWTRKKERKKERKEGWKRKIEGEKMTSRQRRVIWGGRERKGRGEGMGTTRQGESHVTNRLEGAWKLPETRDLTTCIPGSSYTPTPTHSPS